MFLWIPGVVEEEDAIFRHAWGKECNPHYEWSDFGPEISREVLESFFEEKKLPENLLGKIITIYCKTRCGQIFNCDYKVEMRPKARQTSEWLQKAE
jgi:hypothetical protein